MAWDDTVGAILDTCNATFGVDTQYSHNGAPAVSIRGIFDAAHVAVDPETGAPISSSEPVVGYKVAELPGDPIYGVDTVKIKGVDYRVVDDQKDGQGGVNLILKRL